jgi:hypothetical protein
MILFPISALHVRFGAIDIIEHIFLCDFGGRGLGIVCQVSSINVVSVLALAYSTCLS